MKTLGILFTLFFPLMLLGQTKELKLIKGKDEMAKKNYNLALYYFNLAIQKDSLYIEAYNERGLAKFNIGDYKGAMKDYKFVIKNDPENAPAYFGIASVKNDWLNDKYGAIADYTKVIEIYLKKGDNGHAGWAYFMRASVKKDLGDKKGFMSDMKKAAKLGNQFAKTIVKVSEEMKLK